MADSFGIPQIIDYLQQMDLHIASVHPEREMIELAFHGNQGQWRMVISLQQVNQVRKLVLVAPHISTVTRKKRLECLEALMAVNYRITTGKFGLDLDDGEIRLEESVPLFNDGITREQFQLILGAMVETVATYHSLIPRIIYGNRSTQEALLACEQEFLQEKGLLAADPDEELVEREEAALAETSPLLSDLNVQDVMAEVTRLLEERKEG